MQGLGGHLASLGPKEALGQGTQGTKEQDAGWMEARPAAPLWPKLTPQHSTGTQATFSFICTLEDGDIDIFTSWVFFLLAAKKGEKENQLSPSPEGEPSDSDAQCGLAPTESSGLALGPTVFPDYSLPPWLSCWL